MRASIAILVVLGCTLQACSHLPQLPSPPQGLPRAEDVPVALGQAYAVTLRREDVLRLLPGHNLAIAQAQAQVATQKALLAGSWQGLLPVWMPAWSAAHSEGATSSPHGLVLSRESYAWSSAMWSWVINPGQAVFDLLLARQRLLRSQDEARHVRDETIHQALRQYDELQLARAQLLNAAVALQQSEELLRLERVRWRAGAGLLADELRAQTAVDRARQDKLSAAYQFYQRSLAMAATLHLQAQTLVVPPAAPLQLICLVEPPYELERMSSLALLQRADLAVLRRQLDIDSKKQAQLLAQNLSPQLQVQSVQVSPPPTGAPADALIRQLRQSVVVRWSASPVLGGQLQAALAQRRQTQLAWAQSMDALNLQLAQDLHSSEWLQQRLPLAEKTVKDAEQALQLAMRQLQAGAGLTLDVLQAQREAEAARLQWATVVVRYNQAQEDLLDDLGLMQQLLPAA